MKTVKNGDKVIWIGHNYLGPGVVQNVRKNTRGELRFDVMFGDCDERGPSFHLKEIRHWSKLEQVLK
jgi:hypothetical protein